MVSQIKATVVCIAALVLIGCATSRDPVATYRAAYGGDVADPVVNRYVSDIGRSLSGVSDVRGYELRFSVLDSHVVNHFSTNDGHIFVTRGLLEYLGSEAELAAVLSHELAHVADRHVQRRIDGQEELLRQSEWYVTLAGTYVGFDRDAWLATQLAIKAANSILYLPSGKYAPQFDQDEERQAAGQAMRYMYSRDYDVAAYMSVMMTMQEKAGADRTVTDDLLATHAIDSALMNEIEQIAYRDYRPGEGRLGVEDYERNVKQRLITR